MLRKSSNITTFFQRFEASVEGAIGISSTVMPLKDTDYFVKVIDTDPNTPTACAAIKKISITTKTPPLFDIPVKQICVGESIDIATLIQVPDMQLTFYKSELEASLGFEMETTIVAPTANTVYYVKAIETHDSSLVCEAVSEIKIQVNPLPILDVTNTEICEGERIDLSEQVTTASNNRLSYYTSLQDAIDGNNAMNSVNLYPTETTDFFIKATDVSYPTYCTSIATLTITVNKVPTVAVFPQEICFGDDVLLGSLVASSPLIKHEFYTSDPALSTSVPLSNTSVQPTENTVIYIISTDTDPAKQTRCTTTSQVLIKVNPLPTLDIPTQEICVGTSLDIALQNLNGMSATYHSTKNQAEIGVVTLPSTEIEFANTGSFSYFARIVDTTTNCWNVEEIKIQVNPLPALTVTNTEICVGDSINLSSLTNTDSSNRLDYFTSLADAQNTKINCPL